MNKRRVSNTDVAIVGGGMVGLSLAILMAKSLANKHFTVIETHSFSESTLYQPSFDQRSTAISADSVRIFDYLNIWTSIAEHATAIQKVQVNDKGHLGNTAYDQSENHQQALGFVVDNAWLGRCLINAAKQCENITLLAPESVQRLQPLAGAARLFCQHQQIDCELVVVADGANSALRTQLGIETERHQYQQHALIANVEFEKPHHGCAFERFTSQGPVALLPLGESDDACTANLVWTTPEDQLQSRLDMTGAEFLSALQEIYGFRLGAFTRVGERYSYPLVRQIAKEQIRSSVVLMGNAAHSLHPVAGQGFNLALRDAEALTQVLQENQNSATPLGALNLLQKYLDKQASDQWLTTMMSHSFNRVFADERLLLQALRNVGLLSLNLAPPLKRSFFNQMMGKGALAAI